MDLVKLFYNNYQEEIIKSRSRLSDDQTLELVELDKSIISDDEKYVLRQKHKIDILFQVRIDGYEDKLITFVIEDKTWTTAHTDQLNKYRNKISNDEQFKNSEIIFIYFKTGYVYESEEVKNDEFYLFDWEQINSFLSKYESINDPIFTSYIEYFKTNYYVTIKSNLAKLFKKDGFDNFGLDFLQWEFITKLSLKCQEKFSFGIDNYPGYVYKGTSSGRPWTQYEFVKIKIKDFPSEVVYYRLQNMAPPKGKSGYCLRLCLYSKSDANSKYPVDLESKRRRLNKYRILFTDCSMLKFDFQKKLSNRGGELMEISRLHFDNHTNTVQEILNKLPIIHSEFVAKIRKEKSFGEI